MKIAAIAHQIDSLSLVDVPGIEIVAESADLASLRLAASTLCDVVLCDLDRAESADLREVTDLLGGTPIVGFLSEDTEAFRVVDAQRCGCSEFVPKPFKPEEVITAVHRAVGDRSSQGKTICLVGASGGAGATTIACNLAVQLASAGKVGLIDADLSFGNVAQYFDQTPRHTIADVCECDSIDQVSLGAAMVETEYGVSLLARPAEMSERAKVTPGKASGLLYTASRTYNYVLVDLFRQLDELVGSFMLRSNLLLIVTEMNVTSANNARRIRQALLQEGFAEERIAIILNRVTKRSAHALTQADLENTLGPFFAVIPNDFPAALRASDQGKPIDPNSPITKALREMAAKITGIENQKLRTGARFMRLLKGAAP